MSKMLLKEDERGYKIKKISLLESDEVKNLGPQTFKILKKLAEKNTYPKKLAEELDIHEQKVYYHIGKLEKAGLVEVQKKEKKGGAQCKFYKPTAEAFGISLTEGWDRIKKRNFEISGKMPSFFSEFIDEEGIFDGSIVVGSPKQHGPFMTSSRDGHYAIQLGIFLGGICNLENRFVVKLDTEVKAEDALDRNLMLVGGPITNTVSRDVNEHLSVGFNWDKTWKIISEMSGNEYRGENLGLIAKIKEDGHERMLFSGLDFKGTKTCIIGITQNPGEILEDYKEEEEFYRVIKGLDRDGDGKTDDIEILE